jgi:hypothetical protein
VVRRRTRVRLVEFTVRVDGFVVRVDGFVVRVDVAVVVGWAPDRDARTALRSSALSPPHTPNSRRWDNAVDRHTPATGQDRQTAFAVASCTRTNSAGASSDGKNRSGL